MHLKKIILENFRQFYGRQDIDLDISNDENIVVIHGENGAGKTTILEAFSWCLYGEINLGNKDSLLNEKVFLIWIQIKVQKQE
jgi:DNA sulfur modification protein DndD